MSLDIDQLYEMLSWKNDINVQLKGIEEAGKIRHLSVFLQPMESKALWENCAKILINKTDKELEPYLIELFKWLRDMNWPGAELIYDRLKSMSGQPIENAYICCCNMAIQTGDDVWKQVLEDFGQELNL